MAETRTAPARNRSSKLIAAEPSRSLGQMVLLPAAAPELIAPTDDGLWGLAAADKAVSKNNKSANNKKSGGDKKAEKGKNSGKPKNPNNPKQPSGPPPPPEETWMPTPLDTVTPAAGGGEVSNSTYEGGSPDVAYAFKIVIENTEYGMFSEIGGISWKAEPIPVRSGGNNEYSYNLRGPGKFEPLTLKRGWFASSGEFYNLLRLGLQGVAVPAGAAGRFKLTISCLDRKYEVIGRYDFMNCFFVEYTGPGFNSMSGQVGFEQIRVAYDYFTYNPSKG